MEMTVKADEGDELRLQPLQLFDDFAVIRLEVHNKTQAGGEMEAVTLSLAQATALSRALTIAVNRLSGVPDPSVN
jgi:hypothetical protein